MADFLSILAAHAARWPLMTPQDAVKLCYQSAFGPGHMVRDEDAALDRLCQEAAQTPRAQGMLFEPIGGGFCRAHLAAWPCQVPLEILNRAFCHAANARADGDLDGRLALLRSAAEQGRMPFSAQALAAYLDAYRAGGCPAVHHSTAFGGAYHPAYRVVSQTLAHYFPLVEAICAQLAQSVPFSVGIDGRCAAGKTTLADYLRALFGCPIVHMDDFFLPFEQKTPERLAQPGGNADHERFAREVLGHLNRGEAFAYRRYDCGAGALSPDPVQIPAAPLVVVEGSYCLYPPAREQISLCVFLTIDANTQRRRLRARNPGLLRRFENEWIPMEEQYFAAFDVANRCQMRFDGDPSGEGLCKT